MFEETHSGDFQQVIDRLHHEFHGVHAQATVVRCVDSARHGAREVIGEATPRLVERIARQHLQVLELAYAERS
ncbi:hypothetical protein RIF23_14180 [Lipingzhangella sp. LS1_29]|uniref:Uncharacterized protein n=1 Tax=Lipingzhangella rawalii TaxID=2055835 RepID=A0ABU2H8W7_9ACTN|nr:hypothetical protein [Lipingzhangella rawalii]MDS1271442.1 hypothetical protein [Lipingzhangella rawalii]